MTEPRTKLSMADVEQAASGVRLYEPGTSDFLKRYSLLEEQLAQALIESQRALDDALRHAQALRTSHGGTWSDRQLASITALIKKLEAALLDKETP